MVKVTFFGYRGCVLNRDNRDGGSSIFLAPSPPAHQDKKTIVLNLGKNHACLCVVLIQVAASLAHFRIKKG
jgi:hypothetical protein